MAILFCVEICTKTYKDNFCFAASATPMAVACDPDSMSACLATKQLRLWTSNLPQPFQRKICFPIGPKGQETLVCWLGGIGNVGMGWQVPTLWDTSWPHHEATVLRCIKWWLRRRNIPVSKDRGHVSGGRISSRWMQLKALLLPSLSHYYKIYDQK